MWRQSREKIGAFDYDTRRQTNVFSLVVFPIENQGNVNSRDAWKLINKTVLSKENIQYFDMDVENPNKNTARSRIKIQTVTSC